MFINTQFQSVQSYNYISVNGVVWCTKFFIQTWRDNRSWIIYV